MENNTITNDEHQDSEELKVDYMAKDFLAVAAKWAKILSILGFCGFGLAIIVMIFTSIAIGNIGILLLYLVIIGIAIIPMYYLYKFATGMQETLYSNDSANLTDALGYLKSYFQFNGIMVIVIIGIYIVIFLFALIAGASYLRF